MTIAETVGKLLLDRGAVRVQPSEPFTWTSGIKSPIYCDNRMLISFPEARKVIVEGFREVLAREGIAFDVLGGTATAAIPWAAFLAQELGVPMVYIRPKPKEHGAGKQVEGVLTPGARVLIVEDLISTGGSSIGSAAACMREGAGEVVGVLAIFSYELAKAKAAFAEARLPYWALATLPDLLGVSALSAAEREEVLRFAENPAEWRM